MILPSKLVTLKNGKKITLRTLKPFEAQAMLQHLQITHQEAYQNMNQSADYWRNMLVEDEQRILGEFQNSNSRFLLGAVHDETIIGGLGFVGDESEFIDRNGTLGMSIQKKFCGQGLGSEMMKYAIEQAKIYGFHRIELAVRTYNETAIALYEKLGFKRIGTRSECAYIDGKYVDEYLYEIIFR